MFCIFFLKHQKNSTYLNLHNTLIKIYHLFWTQLQQMRVFKRGIWYCLEATSNFLIQQKSSWLTMHLHFFRLINSLSLYLSDIKHDNSKTTSSCYDFEIARLYFFPFIAWFSFMYIVLKNDTKSVSNFICFSFSPPEKKCLSTAKSSPQSVYVVQSLGRSF